MPKIITKPEVTEKYIRIPVAARKPNDRIRTITISSSQGILALYAGNRKKILTYLFKRSAGWTMAKARAWVKAHHSSKTMDKRYIKAYTKKEGDELVVVASDETVDRSGESLKIKDWDLKNYKTNPVLLFGHNYTSVEAPVIGRAKKIWVDKESRKLKFVPEFQTVTKLGRELKKLVEQGFLKTWSVGFLPKYLKKKLTANELLENSLVPVPCNPSAMNEAKMKGLETKLVEKYIADLKKKSKKKAEKQTYNCECLDCGHKMKTDKHCRDIKCPECGGQMRRAERPGPGRAVKVTLTKKYLDKIDKIHEIIIADHTAKKVTAKPKKIIGKKVSKSAKPHSRLTREELLSQSLLVISRISHSTLKQNK